MFKALVHDPVEGSKHVPFIEVNENKVHIRCGKNELHASTAAHYIGWIKLYGLKDNKLIELGSTTFTPDESVPVTEFQLADIKKYTKLVAASYCNVHGIFESEVTVQ